MDLPGKLGGVSAGFILTLAVNANSALFFITNT
jgi:hypothetical protein